jgi:hypothetical protein
MSVAGHPKHKGNFQKLVRGFADGASNDAMDR